MTGGPAHKILRGGSCLRASLGVPPGGLLLGAWRSAGASAYPRAWWRQCPSGVDTAPLQQPCREAITSAILQVRKSSPREVILSP